MSYLVLARKWRPQSFADLVGQEHVARTLANAIDQDRVAHAYLFAGPRGVGKTTSARILSMCLNCENGPTAKPCGKCEVCADIQSGRSLDVIEIDGASNRGIDEIRDLRESVRYMASSGKRKVYIIDEVHMLTTEAFNALLKTLEEPPAHVVFVFATTRATKVPATILSRTIRFEFRRITTEDIVKQLQTVLNGEGMKADKRALHLVARAADGGMRDALSLLEQVRSYGGDKLEAAQVEEALGLVDEELLFAVSNAARDTDIPGVMDAIQTLVDNGGDPSDFLLALEEHFRHLLVGRVSKDPGRLIESTNETIERYKEEAKGVRPGRPRTHAESARRRGPRLTQFAASPARARDAAAPARAHGVDGFDREAAASAGVSGRFFACVSGRFFTCVSRRFFTARERGAREGAGRAGGEQHLRHAGSDRGAAPCREARAETETEGRGKRRTAGRAASRHARIAGRTEARDRHARAAAGIRGACSAGTREGAGRAVEEGRDRRSLARLSGPSQHGQPDDRIAASRIDRA